jgi:gliding motility-associated-like protein
MVNSAGIISNFAGNGILGYSGDGGLATSAQLYHPSWMGLDKQGNLYIIDQNGDVIRKVDNTTGVITTIAGKLPPGYSGDGGPLISAQFRSITGISFDAEGNMFIGDNGNYVIRKVNTLGIVSTVVGNGTAGFSGDGGPAISAQIGSVFSVVFDSGGNMYIPDNGNHRIRKVDKNGIITTYAGSGNPGYSGDGGPATAADLLYPWTIELDKEDNLYIGDPGSYVVRKVATDGIITTYAGNGIQGNSGDGGLATSAELAEISGLCVDLAGNLYISVRDFFHVIKKVSTCLPASILQQPSTVELCNEGDAVLTISAKNEKGYRWQINTGSNWSNLSDNSGYSGSSTNTLVVHGPTTIMNNYQYRCVVSNECGDRVSTTALVRVKTLITPSINIFTSSTNICLGSAVLFTATVTEGIDLQNFQWKKNGTDVGANTNTYTDKSLLNGDIISCILTTDDACISNNTALSNSIITTVTTPVVPSVKISASANNICFGTPVTFTSSVTNGGTAPVFAWFKNGINLLINSSTYIDNSLKDGDKITCSVTSSFECLTTPTAISSPIDMSVTELVSPTVTITSSANSVCQNDAVIFIATPVNAGNNPIYQWEKNGIPIGPNSNTYTDNSLNNNDIVTCTIQSNAECTVPVQATSNPLSIKINTLPIIALDKANSICEGGVRLLDAGRFSSYLWSTGSIDRSIEINSLGQYSVTVTDMNGCKGTGFTNINTVLPSPKKFLPRDTLICTYGNLTLKTTGIFQNYLWNTGSNKPNLDITKPGKYWLTVLNNEGCTGSDTIMVLPKDCLQGFFMPNAFTPDNDGKNDLIKPVLLGNVKQYNFYIFNRWGQQIFQTTDKFQGWNGTHKGLKQDENTFIWKCVYQFENEQTQVRKGSFILIR